MNTDNEGGDEYYDLDNVELGFVVSFRTLRELLATLSVDGRKWWLATDPSMAVENGYVTLAYGYPRCHDPLNTIYFRLPVLSKSPPSTGTDGVAILFDAFHFFLDQPRSFPDSHYDHESLEDIVSAFGPVKNRLIRRLETGE